MDFIRGVTLAKVGVASNIRGVGGGSSNSLYIYVPLYNRSYMKKMDRERAPRLYLFKIIILCFIEAP